MRRRRLLKSFLRFTIPALATLLFAAMTAFGQSDTGRITGVLTDQNGAVVPGATIVVKNDKTSEERTATSTSDGTYIVASLKPSIYSVTATTQGLSTSAANVQVLVGQEVKLNLVLQTTGVEANERGCVCDSGGRHLRRPAAKPFEGPRLSTV